MHRARIAALLACLLAAGSTPAQPTTRVTILVDAFGEPSNLRKDWGFAALVEHDGLRILFDTGNDADLFRHNVESLGVDLTRLDFVVISHRHGDHTDGLRYLLAKNPGVRIYVPGDEYFGGPTPRRILGPTVDTLPAHLRYFDGRIPDIVPHGSPWKHANTQRVDGVLQLAPGVRLVSNVSAGPAFTETPELSLALDTADGQVVVVGCAHPGIERILASLEAPRRPVRLLVGGLHWVTMDDAAVDRLARALRDDWGVAAVAPGHCTGEPGFAALLRAYGSRYVYAGLGRRIPVLSTPPSSGTRGRRN
jgi:7,8-dihydropterin-6-yl-methyl-4-(beta-D-ribofuranosyl)aminobenzene 5'-phosphate synthase